MGGATPAPEEEIYIGQFHIARYADGTFWIVKEDGEGMETSEEKLIELIRDFWSKEF